MAEKKNRAGTRSGEKAGGAFNPFVDQDQSVTDGSGSGPGRVEADAEKGNAGGPAYPDHEGTRVGITTGAAARTPNPRLPLPNTKPKYQMPLHVINRPFLVGDNRQYRTGTIVPIRDGATLTTRKTHWCYQFLYNPNAIILDNQMDDEKDESILMDKIALFGGQQGIGFNLYINRMAEVAGIPTSPRHADEELVRKYGTAYDIEWLYRVINGDPKRLSVHDSQTSANFGFLLPTAVKVTFGPAMYFVGFINGLEIQHTYFAEGMIPTKTEVALRCTRLTGISDASMYSPPDVGAAESFRAGERASANPASTGRGAGGNSTAAPYGGSTKIPPNPRTPGGV